jgi:hypothetical protein
MVYLIWLVHPNFYNIGKRLKNQIFKINFPFFKLFEQGSRIGLLLHACGPFNYFVANIFIKLAIALWLLKLLSLEDHNIINHLDWYDIQSSLKSFLLTSLDLQILKSIYNIKLFFLNHERFAMFIMLGKHDYVVVKCLLKLQNK